MNIMLVPNRPHHSKKAQKPRLKPQAVRARRDALKALKLKLNHTQLYLPPIGGFNTACSLSVLQMNVFQWIETLDVSQEYSDDCPFEYDLDIRDRADYSRWSATVFSGMDFWPFISWLKMECNGTRFQVKGIDMLPPQ